VSTTGWLQCILAFFGGMVIFEFISMWAVGWSKDDGVFMERVDQEFCSFFRRSGSGGFGDFPGQSSAGEK